MNVVKAKKKKKKKNMLYTLTADSHIDFQFKVSRNQNIWKYE